MTNFSPATQAVLNASNLLPGKDSYLILAAVLRAAVDQVVPETAPPLIGTPFVRWDAMDEIRAQLLVIAAELEGQ